MSIMQTEMNGFVSLDSLNFWRMPHIEDGISNVKNTNPGNRMEAEHSAQALCFYPQKRKFTGGLFRVGDVSICEIDQSKKVHCNNGTVERTLIPMSRRAAKSTCVRNSFVSLISHRANFKHLKRSRHERLHKCFPAGARQMEHCSAL